MSWNTFTQKAIDDRLYNTLLYLGKVMTKEERQHYLDNWEDYNPKGEYTYGYDQEVMIILDADPEYVVGGKIKVRKVDLRPPHIPTLAELPNGLSDEDWGSFKSVLFNQPNGED